MRIHYVSKRIEKGTLPHTAGGSWVAKNLWKVDLEESSKFKVNVTYESRLDLKFFNSGKPRLTGKTLMNARKSK